MQSNPRPQLSISLSQLWLSCWSIASGWWPSHSSHLHASWDNAKLSLLRSLEATESLKASLLPGTWFIYFVGLYIKWHFSIPHPNCGNGNHVSNDWLSFSQNCPVYLMKPSPHLNSRVGIISSGRCLMASWSEPILLVPQHESADRTSVAMKFTGYISLGYTRSMQGEGQFLFLPWTNSALCPSSKYRNTGIAFTIAVGIHRPWTDPPSVMGQDYELITTSQKPN